MKTFFGVFSLLAAAIVGVIAVQELHKASTAAGGPGTVITANTASATSEREDLRIQHQVGEYVEVAADQIRFVPSIQDED
jgi:hypothetical protein